MTPSLKASPMYLWQHMFLWCCLKSSSASESHAMEFYSDVCLVWRGKDSNMNYDSGRNDPGRNDYGRESLR